MIPQRFKIPVLSYGLLILMSSISTITISYAWTHSPCTMISHHTIPRYNIQLRNFPLARSLPKVSLVKNTNESDSSSETTGGQPNQQQPQGMSFDDATQAIREEEDKSRMEARGMDLEQDNARMEANKSNFDRMREQIRSRAKDLNVSKSVATVEAIKQATARAMNTGNDSPTTLDLSKVGQDLLDTSDEDDLPEEIKRDLDKVGQLSFWQQAMEEFKNTRFPSMDATLKQAILMIVIFAVTATIILKVDEWLRILYTSWGFIPRSGEIMDYSNLALPEGFTDQMTDADVGKMQ